MLIEDITDNNSPATFLENVKSRLTERAIAEVKSAEYRKHVMNESGEIRIESMEDLTESQKAEIIEGINESADIKEALSSLDEDMNETEIELESGETLVVSESVVNELLAEAKNEKYNKVFRAIAKHCDLDPEKIDDASEKKQKKFYDTLEKCWDEDKDEVPDSCPVDMGMNESISDIVRSAIPSSINEMDMDYDHFRRMFDDEVVPEIKNRYERDGQIDYPARREAWNNMVDSMVKDGQLPGEAESWESPY